MLWSIISIGLILYVSLALLLFIFQAHFIYFPTRSIEATPAIIGLAYETVEIRTEDGVNLSGWFIPAEGAKNIVLFFHGNAGNISHRLASIEMYHHLGLNVFIIDYRGYGQSEGQPGEAGTYLDALAAWRYLVEERQIEPARIIIYGESLGGAVGAWLAERHPPGAFMIASTFTSIPDMAARQYPIFPVRLLARIQYNTLARLPRIQAPILIAHSPDDEIVPYSHAQQLFEAAPEPKTFLKLRGGHNDGFILSRQQLETGLKAFIVRHIEP
jgi:hypothetical protein